MKTSPQVLIAIYTLQGIFTFIISFYPSVAYKDKAQWN